MDDTIKSIWEVCPSKMNNRTVERLFKSRAVRTTMNRLAYWASNKSDKFSIDELKSFIMEGFWKAIQNYRPKHGSLINQMSYEARSLIRMKLYETYEDKSETIKLDDSFGDSGDLEDRILDKITVEEILRGLNYKDRKLIQEAFIDRHVSFKGGRIKNTQNNDLKELIDDSGKSRFRYLKSIDLVLKKARKMVTV